MRRLLIAGAIALAGALGCGAASPAPTTAQTQSANTRALARGVVETTESVWLVAAKACEADGSPAVLQTCSKVLLPLRDALVEAGVMLDAWADVDQANIGCVMQDLARGLGQSAVILNQLGKTVPPAVSDTQVLLDMMAPGCVVDAGPRDGGNNG